MGIYQVYAPKLQLNPFLTAENGDLKNLVYSHFMVKTANLNAIKG